MRRLAVLLAILVLVAVPAVAESPQGLVRTLATDRSPKVRAQAALALSVERDDAEAVPVLLKALADPAPMVRGAAARTLGIIAPREAYRPLAAAARDPDPFVSKWAGVALKALLARLPQVSIGVRLLRAGAMSGTGAATLKADLAGKTLQEAVLETLLGGGRYDVGATYDFSDEGGREGEPGVHVELAGEIEVVNGDASSAAATVVVRMVARGGLVAAEARATAQARPVPAAPGEDEDEYTIRPATADARVVAIRDAGRSAARALEEALQAEVAKDAADGANPVVRGGPR